MTSMHEDTYRTSERWINADIQRMSSVTESSLSDNLPLAAKRAEQLIDALDSELSVWVSVSYMRVENSRLFHVLLLLSREDFLSPKIQAARLLAENISGLGGNYDIRFSFAIESENMMEHVIKFSGYRLMHLREASM